MQRRFSDGDRRRVGRPRRPACGPARTSRIGAAVHSTRAVAPDDIAAVAAWAGERAARRCTPTSPSSRRRTSRCSAAHGATPVGVLAAAGALDERFTAVHATHLTADDVALLGAARCACCICPTTERDLADGIGPTIALRDAGARLTLGSDSHAVIDLLEEARAVELDERLASRQRGRHDAGRTAADGDGDGHASIGWPDAGRIEVGALADLTTVAPRLGAHGGHRRRRRPRRRSCSRRRRPTCTTSSSAAGSSSRDGRHTTLDVAAELRRVLA